MFRGVTKKGKREGRGEIESKPPIEPGDMDKISSYFEEAMKSKPNPKKIARDDVIQHNLLRWASW